MAEEPTNHELAALLAQLLDLASTTNQTLTLHSEELSKVQDNLILLRAASQHTADRVEVCIDAIGAFRSDYLREHPHHDAA
jgi:hypothetical protein